MSKKSIAVLFGGHSSEYDVSLKSAYTVISEINDDLYTIIPIGITKDGRWFYYTGDYKNIEDDTWHCSQKDLCTVVISPDREKRGAYLLKEDGISFLSIDLAFPVLHGKNGEDGTVQGVIELAGIPVAGCDVLSSAICMDKARAHRLAQTEGISCAKSITFSLFTKNEAIKEINEKLKYPIYVKPVRAGSSVGITKVYTPDKLENAVNLAFCHDREVIAEENVDGCEVGCAVIGNENLILGCVDKLEVNVDFLDYNEKYTQNFTKVHVPAQIDKQTEERIKQAAVKIYRALGCCGFARIDMFLTDDNEIYFNEVNTIPGFTHHSRFPKMMNAAGYSIKQTIQMIIDLYI